MGASEISQFKRVILSPIIFSAIDDASPESFIACDWDVAAPIERFQHKSVSR